MERDLQSLLDMLQSAQIVMNYVAGRLKDELATDLQFQDAMIRRLLIIGEASKRVSKKTQQALPTIPWAAINGMCRLFSRIRSLPLRHTQTTENRIMTGSNIRGFIQVGN